MCSSDLLSEPMHHILSSQAQHISKPLFSKKRVFLSRKTTLNKRDLDIFDEEIFELIKPLGFKRVCMDGLTLKQQKKIMAGADIIAGLHGAALTNCLFMRENTHLIEFTRLIKDEKEVRLHFTSEERRVGRYI